MTAITAALWQILDITLEMSPFLLLGFLLAGLMHAFVPRQMYRRYLADSSFRSVLNAALLGVPLPLCSCGVIPTAMSVRKEGASKGATVSFLIATPQTGVDSIIATYSLMGLPFAIIRPIAAFLTALLGGQAANLLEAPLIPPLRGDVPADKGNQNILPPEGGNEGGKLRSALSYAFVEMMEDIGKWLVVGLIVAGLITALVPDSFFAIFRGNTLLSMLLVLAIAIPMYVCATGSIPIAVALMVKGLTPGAALVLLMAGPACNVASILVINKVLGRRTLLAYLGSIIAGSVACGYAIDCLLPAQWFVPTVLADSCCTHEEHLSWLNIASAALLLVLLINALTHHYRHPHCHEAPLVPPLGGDEPADKGNQSPPPEGGGREGAFIRHEFIIRGMNCNHCRANALNALLAIPGVTAADVTLSTKRAYTEGDIDKAQIIKALEDIGFTYQEC